MFPRWLSWLVVLGLIYIIIQGNRVAHAPLPSAVPVQPQQEATVSTEAKKADAAFVAIGEATDMEHWKKAINPDYAKRAQCELKAPVSDKPILLWKVTEEAPGSGTAAKCTDTITVNLTVWNARGETGYQGETKLTLGSREVAAGLDAALVGIRPGGSRTVILSGAALDRDKKSPAAKPLLNAIGAGHVTIVTVERID